MAFTIRFVVLNPLRSPHLHPPIPGANLLRTDNSLFVVVAALHGHIRTQGLDHAQRRRFLKDDYRILGRVGPFKARTDASLLTPTTLP